MSEDVMKWIPMPKRPLTSYDEKEFIRVLITVEHSVGLYVTSAMYDKRSDTFTEGMFHHNINEIKAWASLPEPYNE